MSRRIEIIKNLIPCAKKMLSLSASEESYYPDCPHKSRIRKLSDLSVWLFKYKEINDFYYLYGFDTAVSKDDMFQYLDYRRFKRIRSQGNKNGTNSSQVVLLRDKFLFYQFLSLFHHPVPEVFAARINKQLVDNKMAPVSKSVLQRKENYFAKEIDGECGEHVKKIKTYDDLCQFMTEIQDRDFILQECVEQHRDLSRLNPHSVNTIRMVTVMRPDGPKLFAAFLRIGTADSRERDNTSQGGIAAGIQEDGSLMEYGFRKPEFGGRTRIHPDTRVEFASFTVPFYREAIAAACEAHKLFYRVQSIGWDIAITESGPVFIEGNDNWELQTIQALYGGQRKKLNELFYE